MTSSVMTACGAGRAGQMAAADGDGGQPKPADLDIKDAKSPFSYGTMPNIYGRSQITFDEQGRYTGVIDTDPASKHFGFWRPMFRTNMSPFDTCTFRALSGGVLGAVGGFGFGIFTAAFEGASPTSVMHIPNYHELSTREQTRIWYRNSVERCKSMSKAFGVMGLIFSAVECPIEKIRGQHDILNPTLAGCSAGAIASSRTRSLSAMGVSCAGFAAFSAAIEKFFINGSGPGGAS